MGYSLRCCLACILPCGALDLIRIVHLNGYVEEITGPITASEVLKANPNHVLSKPSNSQDMARKILILSPQSELKRGSIYFLIPASSLPEKKKKGNSNTHRKSSKKSGNDLSLRFEGKKNSLTSNEVSKRKSSSTDHLAQRSSIWQPHLESISED